jgi:hypothetical protein
MLLCSLTSNLTSTKYIKIHTPETLSVVKIKEKGKAVLFQAWSGPEVSRKLKFPDFRSTAQDVSKVVSLRHRPPLPPGNTPCTHFC